MRRLLEAALQDHLDSLHIADLGSLRVPPVSEDGDTYAANAVKKARAVAAVDPAAAILADDSGLEVAFLNGAPGLLSARWAMGPGGAPLDGPGLNEALLRRLEGLSDSGRGARLVCATALVLPGGALFTGWGEVQGYIARDQQGAGGFGYDAVFVLPDGRRLSDVPPAVKDRLGHRGRAVRAVASDLRPWLLATPQG